MSTRVLLFGGHGRVALLLAPLLVERGHTVTAVIRNPDHEAEVAATGANPVVFDVEKFDVDHIANLVRGNDVVVWSAGAGGGNPDRTYAVDRDAAIRSIDAAIAAGARRYVMVLYFGAGADHGVAEDNPFFAYAEAKTAADDYLKASGLDWTILAPSTLTLDAPTGRIDIEAVESASVSRADVAAVIAGVVPDASTYGRTIRFNSGGLPIADAFSG